MGLPIATAPVGPHGEFGFGESPVERFFLLPPVETMRRPIARLLLLVLLAGTFAPLAAAASMPAAHEHCVRTPMGAPADSMPGCHHHAAAPAAAPRAALPGPSSEPAFRSNQCCSGHACCRSLVRSQWAKVSLQGFFAETDRTTDRVSALQPRVQRLDLMAFHSVKACLRSESPGRVSAVVVRATNPLQ